MTAIKRLFRAGTLISLLLLLTQANPAFSANATVGKELYVQTGCSAGTCHGGNPIADVNNVQKGANDAITILNSIDNVKEMSVVQAYSLSYTELQDIAAYIANPSSAGTVESLAPTGATLTNIAVNQAAVTVEKTINVDGGVGSQTYVVVYSPTIGWYQRTVSGPMVLYVAWDGQVSTLADNQFCTSTGACTFNILPTPLDLTGLLPITFYVGERTSLGELKFGAFQVTNQ